jgi:group I intron endonuclease
MARGDYRYAGIYIITNLVNSKVYVGSSINIADRIHCHQSHFRSKIHHNKHLLAAVIQYGIENFSFELWEKCDVKILQTREAYWISAFNASDKEFGYNNSTDTNCPARGRKQPKEEIQRRLDNGILKTRKFVDSIGKIFETNNTKNFAAKQNLKYESLTSVANGNRYSYLGWRVATNNTIGIPYKDIRIGKPKFGRKIPTL